MNNEKRGGTTPQGAPVEEKRAPVRNLPSLSRRIFFSVVAVVFAATILLVAVQLHASFRRFQQDTRQTADDLITDQKEMIRDEVNKVFEEIEYSRSRAETRLKDMVFQRVTEACQIAESLHKSHGTTRPPAEVESLICAALRPLRFNNGRSYYFIVRMDGQCLLLDPWKELEGKDLLKYPASASAVSNMIQIAREQGEGYTEYEWARPGEQTYGHRKIAYVKYVAPLNCFIGTGEYVSDWVADARKALLERIRTISYRRNGYIFVGDWDGMMLAGRVREGENVMDFRDPHGFEITRALIATARQGEGFVSYDFKKPETGERIRKLTFVRGLPEWQWYIGTGVYLDDVDAYLAARKANLRTYFLSELTRILLLLAAIGLLAYLIARMLSRRMTDDMRVFNEFFSHSAVEDQKITLDRLQYKEFLQLARYANTMLENLATARELKAQLEEKIQQAQRLESLGIFAGGIAHDFNNILTGIVGYTEMALLSAPEHGELRDHLLQVDKAANRAGELVKQILAFSRKDSGERRPIHLNLIVKDVAKLIRAAIPSTVQITTHVSDASVTAMADATQIHQVVMNLCANAAYAMQEKNGTISIGLEPIRIGNEGLSVESGSLPAGRYAKLSVRDNGEGIPADILPRIFDPFFTTKPQGKGTGMGLAVVHGIVCSHGGGIRVVSKPGEGALFECYLPIAEAGQPPAGDSATTPVLPHGNGERIIVVDDEPMIVELLSQRLSRLGYRIEVFTSSTEALTHILEHPKSVDVLITDQTMPHLTGFELGLKVKNILPELPIIICTGYSDWLTPALILEKGFSAFFFKPVPTDQLAATLRTLLEKTPAAQQAETLR